MFPNPRQGKKLIKYENELSAIEMRIVSNKFAAEREEKLLETKKVEYKKYLDEHKLNGFRYFQNLHPYNIQDSSVGTGSTGSSEL